MDCIQGGQRRNFQAKKPTGCDCDGTPCITAHAILNVIGIIGSLALPKNQNCSPFLHHPGRGMELCRSPTGNHICLPMQHTLIILRTLYLISGIFIMSHHQIEHSPPFRLQNCLPSSPPPPSALFPPFSCSHHHHVRHYYHHHHHPPHPPPPS